MSRPPRCVRAPDPWQVGLALALVYLCWSTTYLAIQEGMRTLPPLLFGGTRITLAGLLLLAYVRGTGQCAVPTGKTLLGTWLVGCLLFLGGNGLINMGQKIVPSGVASVLVATCPLFIALLERLLPRGERMPLLSWFGLLAGLIGVSLTLERGGEAGGSVVGMVLCLGSSFAWSVGSVLARHWPTRLSLLQTASLQMCLGGATMALTGVLVGELGQIGPEDITPGAVFAFCWLLVVGSLVGYVAYVWLLGHTSAAVAGTYAYVNPALAILIGWAFANETISRTVVIGLGIILCGVALVRAGSVPAPKSDPELTAVRPESGELATSGETGRVPARV
jgi:drug/metabolite transporter (DMT)-like permease